MFIIKASDDATRLLSDQDLVQRFHRAKGASEFTELFERHAPGLYAMCRNYLRDPEESRDAVMQVFEKCLTSFRKAPIDSFSSWLYAMARNECIDILRRNRLKDHRLSEYAGLKANDRFSDHRIPKGSMQNLHGALGKLKKDQLLCIELFFFEERTYREISEETGLSIRAVKTNLQNGKRRLKKLLLEENKKQNP